MSVWLQQREFHLLSSPRWLILIGWAELASWMEVASNNPSFLFPKSIVKAGERLYQWLSEHTVASWNISCRGQKKDVCSSLCVLPLNETGGKLTYRVIVTNIAEGELSVALPPFHCGGLRKKLTAPAVCIDVNLFPDKTRNSLQLGRIPPRCTDDTVCCVAATATASGWLWMGAAWV